MGVGKPGGRDWQRLLTSQPTGTLRTGELTGVYTFPRAQDSSERESDTDIPETECTDLWI